MRRFFPLLLVPVLACAKIGGFLDDDDGNGGGGMINTNMSFFVTSRPMEVMGVASAGGNFGGVAGADAFCQSLARQAIPNDNRRWVAYLSTTDEDARDRIGNGPWVNFSGAMIAANADELHANPPPVNLILDELGRAGTDAADPGRQHDVITGSNREGRRFADLEELMPLFTFPDGAAPYSNPAFDYSCANWTSDGMAGADAADFVNYTVVGHLDWSDLQGGSASWNSSHVTACDQPSMAADLGSVRVYCFVTSGVAPPPPADGGVEDTGTGTVATDGGVDEDAGTMPGMMSFFVTGRRVETSSGAATGGNLQGLAGADAFCDRLAKEAVPGDTQTWRAFLSTTAGDARDRIGAGPWFNAMGQMIAADVDTLLANPPASELLLTERGDEVMSTQHDILTGSTPEGRAYRNLTELMPLFTFPDGSFSYPNPTFDFSCADWTSDGMPGGDINSFANYAVVGHVDHSGLTGRSALWTSSHVTACDAASMAQDLGDIRLYCFAQ